MDRLSGAVGEEMVSVLYELRRNPRFGIPWESSGGRRLTDDSAREHPLVVDLRSARRAVLAESLEAPKILEPFLTVVRSNAADATATAAAICAVDRLVSECCLAVEEDESAVESVGEALDDVIEALDDCKFEPMDGQKDELVLLKNVQVLANVIHLGVPAKLSDATVLSGFEMCLQFIFSRRGSELLRKETEDALMRIARDICSKNFTDEGEDVDYVQPEDIKSLLRESPHLIVDHVESERGLEKDVNFSGELVVLEVDWDERFSDFVTDPSVGRPVRERLLGLRLLTTCIQSLPVRPCAAVHRVLLREVSITILRSLGSMPPPAPIMISTAMHSSGALHRALGSSSVAFLFLLFRSIFSGFLRRKMKAVSREVGMEAMGGFISSPGLVAMVYAALDCQMTLPNVAEGLLDGLGEAVSSVFPIRLGSTQTDMSLYAQNGTSAATLNELGEMSALSVDDEGSDSDIGEGRAEERAIGLMSAKILVDIVESISLRLKNLNSVDPKCLSEGQRLREMKGQKTRLRQAVAKFNETMYKGTGEKTLKLLKVYSPNGFLSSQTESAGEAQGDVDLVANFLRFAPDLEKTHIGVILGEADEFSRQILNNYTKTFDFTNMLFTDAIRIYLESFRLPGESQKIERIMSCFAGRFYEQNKDGKGPLSSTDAAHVLSYSVVMLNTDQHNDSVKKKMTLDDFVRNNRGINDGVDVEREFLERIFQSIVEKEIRMSDEAGVDALTDAHWDDHIYKLGLCETNNHDGARESISKPSIPENVRIFDEDIFRLICNKAVHSAFFLLEEAEDTVEAQAALEGFTLIARCASNFRLTYTLDFIIASLASSSSLRSSPLKDTVMVFGTRIKAQMAAVSMFGVARQSGDWLRQGGWEALIDCVLKLHAVDLLPAQLEQDLCTYGPDLVDPTGAGPAPSGIIPQWWPCERLRREKAENGSPSDEKSVRKTNGLWSIFSGSSMGSGTIGGALVGNKAAQRALGASHATVPSYLRLKTQEELKARELARNCIGALKPEDVLISETRFLRSDSLSCLCSAICGAVVRILGTGHSTGLAVLSPADLEAKVKNLQGCFEQNGAVGKIKRKRRAERSDERNQTLNGRERQDRDVGFGKNSFSSTEEIEKTNESISAFCFDLMCEITLRNRDRLTVTWHPLRAALLHALETAEEGGPLMERVLVTILRVGIRFLHREEVRSDVLSLLQVVAVLDDAVILSFSSFLANGIYQLVKVHAMHITSPAAWSGILRILELMARCDDAVAVTSLETVTFIVNDEETWHAVDHDTFSALVKTVSAYGSVSPTALKLLSNLSVRIKALSKLLPTGNNNSGELKRADCAYDLFWFPLVQAFATLVRMTNGEAQESTMVVLEQILSSDGCEATMRAHDWKDMFCDVLIPLLEEEVKPSESCETQNEEAIGRTKLRGVMTLSKLFLLQHMRISKSVSCDGFVEMWTGVLQVMKVVARQDVKDAKDYVPECAKNMILVMAASNLLRRGSEPLWSATELAVNDWIPQVMDLVPSADVET